MWLNQKLFARNSQWWIVTIMVALLMKVNSMTAALNVDVSCNESGSFGGSVC
jgi:hypothetical protein